MIKHATSVTTIALLGFGAIAAGCTTPRSSITLHSGASDGKGYDFVIPRTVVKIAPSQTTDSKPADGAATPPPKPAGSNNLSFTVVPVISDVNDKPLARFWVSDDSSSGGHLVSTSITAASYADNLVLSAIGTQVTDNRTQAIDAGVSVLGIIASAAGLGLAEAKAPDCTTASVPTFAIDTFDPVVAAYVPGSLCFGYDLKVIHSESDLDPQIHSIAADSTTNDPGLPLNVSLQWFPYPACRTVAITLYSCDPNTKDSCKADPKKNPTVQTLNVSLGTNYRRMLLPVKGKIAFHSDFCGVDVTDDPSGIQSNWALLKQAITDYNNLKQSKATSKSASGK